MTDQLTAYCGASVFDGEDLHRQHALLVEAGQTTGIVAAGQVPRDAERVDLAGGVLAPGYVDLQVNGGGGVMFNDDPSVAVLGRIAAAHATLGATSVLPTLITDTPDHTRAAIDAVEQAVAAGMPGIAGLHLEGPHLALSRKGAHDPDLIRPMEADDLELLIAAAGRLPTLIVTLAPENATAAQVHALSQAGAVVSLGHTDTNLRTCREYAQAGATCVTHLFNAMSQLGNREPGVVGAALALGQLSAGLIADGIHVHPEMISIALKAKTPPGAIFLVTDAMATAGSEIDHFVLNGRRIDRRDGRLTLGDGTLAGADLDLTRAVCVLVRKVGVDLAEALRMATSGPARVIGRQSALGCLKPGTAADFVHVSDDFVLKTTWRGGSRIGA